MREFKKGNTSGSKKSTFKRIFDFFRSFFYKQEYNSSAEHDKRMSARKIKSKFKGFK